MPQRIQRKRTKGWKMPANAVYVGRPTMWGNHFRVTSFSSPAHVVAEFQQWLDHDAGDLWKCAAIAALRGKDLACWCALDQPCHADVLLRFVNNEERP